jgi:hypothetical protein
VRIRKLQLSSLSKARAEIVDALIAAASNDSPRANADRKLAFEMMGDYTPRQDVRHGPILPDDDLADVDADDLRAMAAAPVAEEQDG